MFVVLFRHAHKGTNPPDNPTLSPKGFEQASRLNDLIAAGALPSPTHCWVSELIRTEQTLISAIQQFRPQVQIRPELNIHSGQEESAQFRGRIQKFINELTRSRKNPCDVHYICTHYDWIEDAMSIIDCDKDLTSFEFASWAPGQFIVFDLSTADQDGQWKFFRRGGL